MTGQTPYQRCALVDHDDRVPHHAALLLACTCSMIMFGIGSLSLKPEAPYYEYGYYGAQHLIQTDSPRCGLGRYITAVIRLGGRAPHSCNVSTTR